ncbi:MAG: cellulase family glycosylhydrolase [Actinomycetota bacterium]|nr:cellulase family glycosylhydrolase [Actinomycetota bacterium]
MRRFLPPALGALVGLLALSVGALPARAEDAARPPASQALVSSLKVVNYYPATAAWADMWTSWDPATLDRDFARIAALNANAVRLIVFPYTFGYPDPTPTMTARLEAAIALASKHGLRVQLTLFDSWAEYSDHDGSARWLTAILAPYTGDPRIAFVELRNELPTTAPALAWASTLIGVVRSVDPRRLVTISTSGSEGLDGLRRLEDGLAGAPPDFYDFHYYGEAALAYRTLAAAKALVAPAPLFVGETGQASAGAAGLTEAKQDHYLRTVDLAARALGLGFPAPWTLFDFASGAVPWPGAPASEYAFGLYRRDGRAKPAARSESAFFATGAVDRSFNNGFERGTTRPSKWERYAGGAARFARRVGVARSGSAAACISRSRGTTSAVPAFMISPVAAHVRRGRAYTLSVWAKGTNIAGDDRVAIAWFDGADRYLGQAESVSVAPGTSEWTKLVARSEPPPAADHVELHLKSAHEPGTVCFDDVVFAG